MARRYEYRRLRRADVTEEARRRFWQKVDKTGECWVWRGAITNGYGQAVYGLVDGKSVTTMAHKIAYVLRKGDIPARMTVAQRCGTRACVRPGHLFLRSFAERTHAHSKLGMSGAENVRACAPVASYAELADVYDISSRAIANANNNRTYHDPDHVPQQSWRRHKITAATAETMFEAYDDGDSIYQIARDWGMSYSVVWEVLHPGTKRVKVDGRRVTVKVDA